MKSQRKKAFMVIAAALVMSLALAAPPASTNGGTGASFAPPINKDESKKKAEASKGADAYQRLLPELAAPHRKKLESELGRLRKYADELAPRVLAAQKKAGFDAEAVLKEFQVAAVGGDAMDSAERLAKFHDKYRPQLLTLAKAAGLNLEVERSRLTSLIDLGTARHIASDTIGVGGMDEGNREAPPTEPPPPDVTMQTFVRPFTSEGHSGEHADSDAATGEMHLSNALALAGSAQKLAFITQDLAVARGTRRVRVFITITPTDYSAFAFNLAGYSSAEAIVNLRLLEGSRVLASDRLSLGRAVAAAIGDSRVSGSRAVTLQCELTRPAPDDETTYTLVAEIEGWAGAGGLGGAASNITARLGQFQVYLHRR